MPTSIEEKCVRVKKNKKNCNILNVNLSQSKIEVHKMNHKTININ